MQDKAILGIDISKRRFDVCLIVNGKIRHKVFDNQHVGYQKLEEWCKKQGAGLMHICMEATGTYMEDLAHHMYDLGHIVSVVNAAQIKAFTKSELLRSKTDKADAAAIARFCQAHNPAKWHPQPLELRQLRDMYRCLQGLKMHKQQMLNKLENNNMHIIARNAIVEVIDFLNKQIGIIEREIKKHIDNHPDLKEKIELLTEIDGIGDLTACAIIAQMPGVENFNNAKQYAAFIGLTPSHYQSGSSINRKSKICKIGAKGIRKALYMPAIVVKNNNEHFREFCHRLACKGKAPKVIIVALMRKIVHIFFGMLKRMQRFNPALI